MSTTVTGRIGVQRVYRTYTSNNPPASNSLKEGEISVEVNDPVRMWIGCPLWMDPTGRRMIYQASAQSEAPPDGQVYGRRGSTESWEPVLPFTGGTLTGTLTIGAPGTWTLGRYAQNLVVGNYVNNPTITWLPDNSNQAVFAILRYSTQLFISQMPQLGDSTSPGTMTNYMSFDAVSGAIGVYEPINMGSGATINLSQQPTAPMHAVPKSYVDNNFLMLSGGQITNTLTINTIPTGNVTPLIIDSNLNHVGPPMGFGIAFGTNFSGGGSEGDIFNIAGGGNPGGFSFYQLSGSGVATRILNIDGVGNVYPTASVILPSDPTTAMAAATRQYVDAISANLANYLPLTGGTVTGALTVNGVFNVSGGYATITSTTAATNLVFNSISGQGNFLSGMKSARSRWLLILGNSVPETGSNVGSDFSVVRYNDAGNQIDIPLTISRATAAFNIGGTIYMGLGTSVTLYADPTLPMQATTKQYNDNKFMPYAGGTFTGGISFGSANAASNTDLSRHIALFGTTEGFSITANRFNITTAAALYIINEPTGDAIVFASAGITVLGNRTFTLAQDPQLPLHASTKQYTDTKLPLAGGTLTGPLILAADPTVPLGAATRQYADTKLPLAGGTMLGYLILNGDPQLPLGSVTKQYVDAINPAGHYLPLTGGTMMGALQMGGYVLSTLRQPVNPSDAATKSYVDQIGNAAYQSQWHVASNTPNLITAAATNMNAYEWYAVTANPNVPETAPPGIPGIAGQIVNNGDRVIWSTVLQQYDVYTGGMLDASTADARYLLKTGDTMVGPLTMASGIGWQMVLASNPQDLSRHIALWQGYGFCITPGSLNINTGANLSVYNTGTWTMTLTASGMTLAVPVLLPADPTTNMQASTRQYVDAVRTWAQGQFLPLTGGVMTGPVLVQGTAPSDYSNQRVYVTNYNEFIGGGPDGAGIDSSPLVIGGWNGIGLQTTVGGQMFPAFLNSVVFNPRNGVIQNFGALYNLGNYAQIGMLRVYTSGSQCMLDTPTSLVASVAVNAGGTGWNVNDRLYDTMGNTYTVTSVATGGIVTGLQLSNAVVTAGGLPTNPVLLHAAPTFAGTGCTANLTWTQCSGLAVNTPTLFYQPASFDQTITAVGHASFQQGIDFANVVVSSPQDLSRGINLWGGVFGFNITNSNLNINGSPQISFYSTGNLVMMASSNGLYMGTNLFLYVDPTSSMHAVTKQYDDRNRGRNIIDVTTNAASPSVSDVDWAYLYVYGNPTGPATVTMPVANTTRLLWDVNNTTNQPVTFRGVSGAGTITVPAHGSRAIWTDTGGIYPLNTVVDTPLAGDSSLSIANTQFVAYNYLALTGGTVNATVGASVGANSPAFFATGSPNWVGIYPNIGQGAYSPIVQAIDSAILFSSGASDTGNLVIAPWSTTNIGIRISAASSVSIYGNTLALNGTLTVNGVAYIPASGNAFNVGSPTTASTMITVNGAVGNSRGIAFYSAGNQRWNITEDQYPESGGNNGSNFRIVRFADNGSWIDFPLTVNRTDGTLTLANGVTGQLTISAGGGWGGNNVGKQLLITTPVAASNPGIAITDSNQANYWGLINFGGVFTIAAMPPYSDNTTGPAQAVQISRSGLVTLPIGGLNVNGGGVNAAGAVTASPDFIANTPTPNWRHLSFQTNGVQRWAWQADNAGETGGNAGSNLQLVAFSDTGAAIANVFVITRATGALTINTPTTFSSGATFVQLTGTQSGGGAAAAVRAMAGGNATFFWEETGQPLDQKKWDAIAGGGNLFFRAVNDSESSAPAWLSVSRSGAVVQSITLTAPAVILPNNETLNFTDVQGSNSPRFILQSDNNFVFYGSNSTGGSKAIWSTYMHNDSGTFQVSPLLVAIGGIWSQNNLTLGAGAPYGWPTLALNATPNTGAQLIGEKNGLNHWVMRLGSDAAMIPYWAASTAYPANNRVLPPTNNGYSYTNSAAGTSGATAPAWPTTIGATVVDGTVTWTCAPVINLGSDFQVQRYDDAGRYIPNDPFTIFRSNAQITFNPQTTPGVLINNVSGVGLEVVGGVFGGNGDAQIQMAATGQRSWLIGSQGSTFLPGQFIIYDVTSQRCPFSIDPIGGNVNVQWGLVVTNRLSFAGSDGGQLWDDGNAHWDGNSNFWIGHNVAGSWLFAQAQLQPQMGLIFPDNARPSTTDFTRHIQLYSTGFGINITGARLNVVASGGSSVVSVVGSSDIFIVSGSGASVNGQFQSSGGNIIAARSGGNPSHCCWDLNMNWAAGMFAGGTNDLYFGQMDANGNYIGGNWYGYFDNAGNFTARGNITANSGTLYGNVSGTAGYAYQVRSAGGWATFNWAGQGGQPSWLWGSNDGTNFYVWNPSNFSVNYSTWADNCGSNFVARSSVYPAYNGNSNWLFYFGSPWNWYQHTSDQWRMGFDGNTGDWVWIRGYDGQWSGHLDGSGNWTVVGNVYAANVSDIRVKRDIEPFTRGMDALMQLQPAAFFYNGLGGTKDDGRRHVSVHAQDLLDLIPEAVITLPPSHPDNPQPRLENQMTIEERPLLMVCINAIKELNARLAEVERIIS